MSGGMNMSVKKETRKILRRVLGKKVAKKVNLDWIVYGAAAYYGLRFLNNSGIFPKAGAALDVIDRGLDAAQKSIGLTDNREQQMSHH
jgi:hypothetical protein